MKCVTETKNVAVLCCKNLKSSFSKAFLHLWYDVCICTRMTYLMFLPSKYRYHDFDVPFSTLLFKRKEFFKVFVIRSTYATVMLNCGYMQRYHDNHKSKSWFVEFIIKRSNDFACYYIIKVS